MVKRPGWDAVARVVTLFAVGTQLGSLMIMTAVIERASRVHAAAIAQLPMDTEVAALDDARKAHAAAWRAAADWSHPSYPLAAKLALGLTAFIGVVGCHVSVLAKCFVVVTVADPYDGYPLYGEPLRVIYGAAGWLVIASFVVVTLGWWLHAKWLSCRIAQTRGAREVSVEHTL